MHRRTARPARAAAACLACAALIGPAPAALAAPAAGPPDRSTIHGCAPPPSASDPAIPWAQRQFFPQRVWKVTRGAGVVVAVVDSGVDANSPQLAGAVLSGVDVSGAGAATSDCTGQGTFVAGVIAARQVHGVGFAGLAPEARILPVRVLDDQGNADPAMLAKGIRAAADAGARVINVSPSTSEPSSALQAAVQYAQSRDALVVAAAAASADGRSASYPAGYDGVLGVGAVNQTGEPGAASETGTSVDLVAPGEGVVSIGPGGPGHWQGSGTAYATPFVSAAAALVRAYHPDLTAAEVAERLRTTANRSGGAVPDPRTGWGVVNPYTAVTGVVTGAAHGAVPPGRVQHPVVPPPDPWPARIVAATTAAAVGAGALGWLASVVVPAGRRRSWRPARGARTAGEATGS
ncbi:type VII secretion-associated serine protease mycosin [Saccharopolyspora rosea]|uniref:Type VII secretion-associated serine protease mycosin n=1 Tax=Saccharopolyspora rosea TaxID=524884 RepID=A0ABW3FM72_9PSEU|nr:type VII secretion-associated serine protease mycosin [Saccharopolyspora rosea]